MSYARETAQTMVQAATGRSIEGNVAARVADHLIERLYVYDPSRMAYQARARWVTEHELSRMLDEAIEREVPS